MEVILNELKAIPYIVIGVIILFVGMLLSDLVTGTFNRLWKRKE